MLPDNRLAVLRILDVVSPQILGKRLEGFSCNCGCVYAGPAVAYDVEPAGDVYAGQETAWYLWTVKMRCLRSGEHSYDVGLSDFIPHEKIEELFRLYFPKGEEMDSTAYELAVEGEKRVRGGLPPAVCIMEKDGITTFRFDWGREQKAPDRLVSYGKGEISRKDAIFTEVMSALLRLDPEVYRNGPEPVLPFESKRLTDYHGTLRQRAGDSDRLRITGVCRDMSADLDCISNMSITFFRAEEA